MDSHREWTDSRNDSCRLNSKIFLRAPFRSQSERVTLVHPNSEYILESSFREIERGG